MWWSRRKRPNPDAVESDDALRVQLIEASRKLRRQIEVQNSVRSSRGGGYGGDDLAVQILQKQLDQIDETLANLDRS